MQGEKPQPIDPRAAILSQYPEVAAIIRVVKHGAFNDAEIKASTFSADAGDTPGEYRQRLLATYPHPVQQSLIDAVWQTTHVTEGKQETVDREAVNEIIKSANTAAGRMKQFPAEAENTFRSFLMGILKGEIDIENMPAVLKTEIKAFRGLDTFLNTDNPEVQENLTAIKQVRELFGSALDGIIEEKLKAKVTAKDLGIDTQEIVGSLGAIAKAFDAFGNYDIAQVQSHLENVKAQFAHFGIYEKTNISEAVRAEFSTNT